MEKGTKKIIAGTGILVGVGLAYLYTKKGEAAPPPPPPPPGEDVGMLQGHILDSSTGERLPSGAVLITIDHVESIYNNIDTRGTYRTSYLAFGMHHFSVQADNYQTGEFDLEISEPFAEWDFVLEPLPEAPTDWTEGVEVREIHVTSPVYVGETVVIGVSIVYPYPLPLPADIYGSILINDQELTGQWTIDIRNPRLYFEYTPTVEGTYLVRAQDKSATFQVIPEVISTFYNPFGGPRFPVCTKLTVPTPSGDVELTGNNIFKLAPYPPAELVNSLPQAYPSEWSPPEAVVTQWEKLVTTSTVWFTTVHTVVVMPTDYDCPPYWYSKAELAEVIGDETRIPDRRWLAQFGDKIKLAVGWRDWEILPHYWSRCGGGYCDRYLDCPICDGAIYCGRAIRGSARDRERDARILLEHIETSHPDHPLTEPAWF